jgi:hypothetical protein
MPSDIKCPVNQILVAGCSDGFESVGVEVNMPHPCMAGLDGLLEPFGGDSNVSSRVIRTEADLSNL